MGVFGVGMVGTLHGVTLMMRVRFFPPSLLPRPSRLEVSGWTLMSSLTPYLSP